MKRIGVMILTAAIIALSANAANAVYTCKVTDPTGTPLNVRSEPTGGKVVRTLKNGTEVIVGPSTEDGRWTQIIPLPVTKKQPKLNADGFPIFDGWVFTNYLSNGKCLP
jgi:hypothetical protein